MGSTLAQGSYETLLLEPSAVIILKNMEYSEVTLQKTACFISAAQVRTPNE